MNSPNMSSSSKQSLIDSYFKTTGQPSKSKVHPNPTRTQTALMKKRSLSLVKSPPAPSTPPKTAKLSEAKAACDDVINISSDEEDIWENTPKLRVPCINLTQHSTDSEDFTDCSQKTIDYTPTTPRTPQKLTAVVTSAHHSIVLKTEPLCEPNSPNGSNDVRASSPTFTQKVSDLNQITDCKPSVETPQKLTSCSQSHKTPGRSSKTREKFFSPTRKRNVVVKTPLNKVKRSLSTEMARSMPSRILFEDDLFTVACEGMDDKTKFLLHTINTYLNTPTVKHLLSEEEQTLLTNCLQVVKPGMRLVCRLYWRDGSNGWFKKEKATQICSESKEAESIDDPSFNEMMHSLIENGLIVQGSTTNMTFDDLVAILKRDELKQICKELKLQMYASKQEAVEALKSFSRRSSNSNISHYLTGYTSSNAERVLKIISNKAGPCYKLTELARKTLYKLYIIMFLGMDYSIIREKRLELILLYDKIKREPYPISEDMELDDASVVFRTRDEFERYLAAHNIYEDYLTRTEVSEKSSIVKLVYSLYKEISDEEFASYTSLPKWLYRYTPPYIYVKILGIGIQELKKEKDYALASEILTTLIGQGSFRQHKKAEWYAEQALILHTYLGQYDEAAKVLLEGFKSNLSEEAKDHMRERAKKIANQKNAPLSAHLKVDLLEFCHMETLLEKNLDAKHVHKQPMDRVGKRGKVKFETRTSNGGRTVAEAEDFCIGEYLYTKEFTHGEHWEGRIVNTLFFLLFWDIIYSQPAEARGVFLCRYQMFPLDLFTDSFYANRRQSIEDWLYAIQHSSEDKLLKMMEETWNSRPESEVSGLSRWRAGMRWESVRAVAACLGPTKLAALCRRLAHDYGYARSGFPDLTLWNVNTHRIKFVEVKTDSDKPSTKQKQWMHYLRSHDIETEFCYVGAQTTRQRARLAKPTASQVKVEHEQ